jgi:hypothetical protein
VFTRELTDVEHRVTDLFLVLVEEPEVANRDEAARLALGTMARGSVSADFALWLSEGRYTVYHGHILAVDLLDEATHPLTREEG